MIGMSSSGSARGQLDKLLQVISDPDKVRETIDRQDQSRAKHLAAAEEHKQAKAEHDKTVAHLEALKANIEARNQSQDERDRQLNVLSAELAKRQRFLDERENQVAAKEAIATRKLNEAEEKARIVEIDQDELDKERLQVADAKRAVSQKSQKILAFAESIIA